ncbi:MAG: 4-(cytidine 5'-diphospho)-2-C-methyl-D-erythritol kinase [Candidatus Omnitrophica bacterium]|nr:4-(cytidine 5'-diphospho)-2-C-methyl-D-erythritol kinase [Candidatus Omnitrophota bacterium]MCM8791190.1 4-(cytidine 5'-diphospho)-2-C-methyl-D-erythritol kinase [Candidatus Omnitrophota bacterium]
MRSIVVEAPAKVNLFLKVLGRRQDGYHEIFTLFERISLSDMITISRAPEGIKIVSNLPITAKPKDNIAYKAAAAILSRAGLKSGLSIRIKKVIPIAAGLGGGSSDAAAVLTGVNKLLGLGISKKELMKIGAKLGADVPFFILNEPFAIGRGIGDRLSKVRFRGKLWHLIVYPGFKVATRDIYRAFDRNKRVLSKSLTRYGGGVKMTFPTSLEDATTTLHNDLEGVVIGKKPVIGKIIQCLASSLGRRTMVSGSGPSVFCLYRTRREAIRAKTKLFRSIAPSSRRRWRIFIVETKI